MSYLIYARKYRPMNFEEMIGQKPVVQTLKNAVKNDRVSQAYIFSGMRGVGKTTAARILAKALNCKEGPTPAPCNKCEFCTAINEDRSVDVLEIDGASNRGIDEVRSLREGVKYKPIHSRYKVIIIDEVHMLTIPAFNALLKTLEEPPAYTVFIFATTEFHKVPATIISRCQHFEFKKISKKELINHLLDITKKENITVSSFGLNLIADAADGSLRDVLSLLDQAVAFSGDVINDEDLKEILGTISQNILLRFSAAILEENSDQIFALVEEIIENGFDLRFFYKELIQHFRNLLLVRTVRSSQDLIPFASEDLENLKKASEGTSIEELLRYLIALQEGEQGLKFSSHPRIYLEALLVKLCHFRKIVPLTDILSDIKDIKKELKGSSVRAKTRDYAQSNYSVNERGAPPLDPMASRELSSQVPQPKQTKKEPALAKKELKKEIPTETPEKGTKQEREVDIAMKDPTVKNFMDTFKAQILSVEQIKKSKKE
ncbi:MAG: DNA polymerase III subunit gamma/tau [Candidatus Aminicenantes bacterium]|jgi:DNA polymerase-3 subunit gamma/tau